MIFFSPSSPYRLRHSKRVLRHTLRLVQKKKRALSTEILGRFKEVLLQLEQAILDKDRIKANELVTQLSALSSTYLKKTMLDHLKELSFALSFALIVAILVRQVWFEFYEIPTGSMRPTLKEQDRLVVSKTDFGINVPLQPDQFYFDPSLVVRNNIVTFTGENMDIRDVDTLYFYLFPGKKQYVKRLIGKPGDLLYFYGGLIYGMDREGNDLSAELQLEKLNKIDHIPFIDFDRKLVLPPTPIQGVYSPVFIYQMNEPIAKLYMTPGHQAAGEMVFPSEVHDPHAPIPSDYGDLWGIKNYGMARLLTREQVKTLTETDPSTLELAPLYLEIRHHPSLSSVKLIRDELGRLRPSLGISTSLIPMQEDHLNEIFRHLYTARFEVKNGIAFRSGSDPNQAAKSIFSPRLPHVPDGVYEFYDGVAYEIHWQGITTPLPSNHPLYHTDPAIIQLFFNLGIEWDIRFSPQNKQQRLTPSRYTYFRFGDLYLMGAPVLLKKDQTLQQFLQKEQEKKNASNPSLPYQPFEDLGPPRTKDGQLDKDLLKKAGLLIPPKSYLMLGDNHAMSADSREFGFVPESNLRGGPDFIFWPPGPRWGTPNQVGYPFFNLPRTIVWGIAAFFITAWSIWWRRKNRLPLSIEKKLSISSNT